MILVLGDYSQAKRLFSFDLRGKMKKAGASCTKNAILFYDGHFSLVHLTKKILQNC